MNYVKAWRRSQSLTGADCAVFKSHNHLYGIARDELSYILDTFPIVRRKDEGRWGEYRTKRLVLEGFESLKR